MKLRTTCLLSTLLLAFLLAACGDDDGTVPTDSGPGGTDAGGPVVDSGSVPTDSGGAAVDSGSTPTDAGGMSTGDGGTFTPSAAATYFCMGYMSVCMFGTTGHYADNDTCLRAYDGYSMTRALCVANALGMAGSDPAQCLAAAGAAPCN